MSVCARVWLRKLESILYIPLATYNTKQVYIHTCGMCMVCMVQ